MEKKKMKLWKKVLIILLIIFAIFSINVARKAIILSSIDKKVTALENNNHNIYIKTIFDYSEYKSKLERFIKDDVDKMVLEKTDTKDGTIRIIQITYPNERKLYTEHKDNKIMYTYQEKAPIRGAHIEIMEEGRLYTSVLANAGYSTNWQEKILTSSMTKIRTTEIEGRKYYELFFPNNPNFIYKEDSEGIIVFVDMETGLMLKSIEKVKKDGNIEEEIVNYEYKFNEVTDKEMEEPDSTQYVKTK